MIQERIEQLAAELVGGRPGVTHRWAGIWGTSPDGLPLVGRVPGEDRVWVAAGYSGHGNVMGTWPVTWSRAPSSAKGSPSRSCRPGAAGLAGGDGLVALEEREVVALGVVRAGEPADAGDRRLSSAWPPCSRTAAMSASMSSLPK